jgi:hypothetical protein
MKEKLFNWIYLIEAMIKLYLIKKSLPNSCFIFQDHTPPHKKFRRWICILQYHHEEKRFLGMAEGGNVFIAKLRAFAEAYEKFCLDESKIEYIQNLPQGLGVGIRKKTAIKRAYGEYFERKEFYTEDLIEINDLTKSIASKWGNIYISYLKNGKIVGTGYGLTPSEAKDSAKRSFWRESEYPQKKIYFVKTEFTPIIVKITSNRLKLLECYFVGHINN